MADGVELERFSQAISEQVDIVPVKVQWCPGVGEVGAGSSKAPTSTITIVRFFLA